jgi:hypothetical protein
MGEIRGGRRWLAKLSGLLSDIVQREERRRKRKEVDEQATAGREVKHGKQQLAEREEKRRGRRASKQ